MSRKIILAVVSMTMMSGSAFASELVYRPTNPSFGGDALNGNWLLAQAAAQNSGGGGGDGGFVIDFPDFGGLPQEPEPTDPQEQPNVPITEGTGGGILGQ